MRKLTLNPDMLQVQSFATSAPLKERGTVHGEQGPCTCPNCTCPGCPTCIETCPDTCANTCDTCGFSCGAETCGPTCYTMACICRWSDEGTCIC